MDEETKMRKDCVQPCILFPGCPYLTAVCRVSLPDDGCYVYRWFKRLISEDEKVIMNRV